MRTLVVGLGNRWRGDDAAGPLVLDGLRELNLEGVDLLESPGDSLSLINAWEDRADVFLIDACCDESLDAGEIVVINDALTNRGALANLRHPASSHVLDLEQAIALSETLGKAPKRLVVYSISAKELAHGDKPCGAVGTAIEKVKAELVARLKVA